MTTDTLPPTTDTDFLTQLTTGVERTVALNQLFGGNLRGKTPEQLMDIKRGAQFVERANNLADARESLNSAIGRQALVTSNPLEETDTQTPGIKIEGAIVALDLRNGMITLDTPKEGQVTTPFCRIEAGPDEEAPRVVPLVGVEFLDR